MGEVDDRGDDGVGGGSTPTPATKDAVDLDHVDREAAQVAERRVAGAEVVDGEAHAERLQVEQRLDRRLDVVHQHALGDLEDRAARVEAGLGAGRPRTVSIEVGLAELAGRDVDRQRERRLLRVGRPRRDLRGTPRAAPSRPARR